jgi:tetratricopeptide (TPR) repeat protein
MLFVSARTGVAQEADAPPPLSDPDAAELDRAARSLFEAGKIAFDLGRYEEALEYLQQAHDLSQRPILLFNIASTLDRLRRDQEALDTFERYLREVPDAANKLAGQLLPPRDSVSAAADSAKKKVESEVVNRLRRIIRPGGN